MSAAIRLQGALALVTGGAGFVGSHLVDALVREGARVKIVDNLTRGGEANLAWAKSHGSIEFLSSDIRDAAVWERALPGVDVVFHQAALRVNRCEENPQECWEVMIDATHALLNACAAHGVKKVVAASSAIVYGKADQLPTPETHHLNHNTTWYGTAKILNEQLLNTYYAQRMLPGIALRYFNIYGPRMATQGHTEVLVKWFQALDSGQPIRIFGDGSQTMDWVHVQDIAHANILAAQSAEDQGVFNVGSGEEKSLLDLGKLVMKAWGRSEPPELVLTQNPSNPIPRRWADISKARQLLMFNPQFNLENGIRDILRWWRDRVQVA